MAHMFSHQNGAGSHMCITWYWENLILEVGLILEA